MRILLYVEGKTEHKALAAFLKKWLDRQLDEPVRCETVQFNGFGDYLSHVARRAPHALDKPGTDIIAVFGLLDIYGLTLPFPKSKTTMQERVAWAKRHIENGVGHPRFHQFFAVHETEAWLLSDPKVFQDDEVEAGLLAHSDRPETVNDSEPPSKLLKRLYRVNEKKDTYKKVNDGTMLFSRLDPNVAYAKCPNLKAMLDEMLRLAQEAGL